MLMNPETSGKALELQAGAVESADIALNHVKKCLQALGRQISTHC